MATGFAPDNLPTAEAAASTTSGALLGQGAVLVWNDVAAEGREQFYEWHDKEHIPERLAIAGFRRGRRYAKPGHSPEWFTLYEADDLDVVNSPAYLARLDAPTAATQRTLRYFRNTSRAVCRIAWSTGSSSGGHMLTLRLQMPHDRHEDAQRTIGAELFPRAMAMTGVVACHLYSTDQASSRIDTAESRTRTFDVPGWVLLAEATHAGAAAKLAASFTGSAMTRLGVTVRDQAAVYTLEICRLASSHATH